MVVATLAPPTSALTREAEAEALRTLAEYFRPALQAEAKERKHVVYTPFPEWAEENFYIAETRAPIKLFPHQHIICRLMFEWALSELHCQTLVYSTTKKSGKTAMGAAVARWIAETWGPYGEVFALANSLDQAKGRTYAAVLESLELDPTYDTRTRSIPKRWEVTDREATFLPTNSVITAIANSHKGAAGSNPSASIYSELWGYQAESDKRLWAEMTPVPTRERSIRFVETYAGYVGESDILHNLYNLVTKAGRQLEDSEVPDWPYPEDFQTNGGPGVPFFVNENAGVFAYWDEGERARRMPWQLAEHGRRYYQMQAAELLPNEYERLHLNHWVSSVSSFIPMEWWDRIGPPHKPTVHMPPHTGKGSEMVIAADASVTGDCTGIVGVRRSPADSSAIAIVLSEMWAPSPGHPMDYSTTLEPRLRQLISGHIHPLDQDCKTHSLVDRIGQCVPTTPYNVVQLAYDAYQLHDLMTRLRNEGLVWARSFSQNNERMIADKQLCDMIRDQRISHNGDPNMRQHISDAAAKTAKDENTKLRIVKKSASSKIDLAVCASMAVHECKRLLL